MSVCMSVCCKSLGKKLHLLEYKSTIWYSSSVSSDSSESSYSSDMSDSSASCDEKIEMIFF